MKYRHFCGMLFCLLFYGIGSPLFAQDGFDDEPDVSAVVDTTVVPDTCFIHVAALAIPDSLPHYYTELLSCYRDTGAEEDYLQTLNTARSKFPHLVLFQAYDAEYRYEVGDYLTARDIYDSLMTRVQQEGPEILKEGTTTPDSTDYLLLLDHYIECLVVLDDPRADSTLADARNRYPDNQDLLLTEYESLMSRPGNTHKARRTLETFVTQYPRSPGAWYFLGETYLNLNLPFKARHAFINGIDTLSTGLLFVLLELQSVDDFLAPNLSLHCESFHEVRTYWTYNTMRYNAFLDKRLTDWLYSYLDYTYDQISQHPRNQGNSGNKDHRTLQALAGSFSLIPPIPDCYLSFTGERYLNVGVMSLLQARIDQDIHWGEADYSLFFNVERQTVETNDLTPRWEYTGDIDLDYKGWTYSAQTTAYYTPNDVVLIAREFGGDRTTLYGWEERKNHGLRAQASVVNHVLDNPKLNLGFFASYLSFDYLSQFYSSPKHTTTMGLTYSNTAAVIDTWEIGTNAQTGIDDDGKATWSAGGYIKKEFRLGSLTLGGGYQKDTDTKLTHFYLTFDDIKL